MARAIGIAGESTLSTRRGHRATRDQEMAHKARQRRTRPLTVHREGQVWGVGKIRTGTLSSFASFRGQQRPGVLKLGSISIGMAADGQQLGVITFRLLAVPGQLCRMGGT